MSKSNGLRHQQLGLSLVELMVALVLGLVLMTGIIQVFLSSRQTYTANDAMARMQENGRFALEFISRTARNAGYLDAIYQGDRPLALVRPLCTGLSGIAEADKEFLCPTNGAGNASDSVAFVMQPPLVDGKKRDCLGNALAAADENDLIINYYSISASTLGCRAYNLSKNIWISGSALQPLVDGVDSLQVLYGVNTSGDARSANQYVSADRVGNNLSDWQKVRSIRISVLANSVVTTDSAPVNRQFVLLDAAPLTAANLNNDRRSRQIFTTTIQLKNTD